MSAVLAVVLVCAISPYAFAQESLCDRNSQSFKLKVKVKNNTPTAVVRGFFGRNSDNLHVCPGDTIEWKYSKKGFVIDFPQKTPFDSKKKNSKNNKVIMTVRSDAERGASYKYNVGLDDGGVLDPVIIID